MSFIVAANTVLAAYFFRDDITPDEFAEFHAWAIDPANQTPTNFARCGIYHPIIRQVWEELGLVKIVYGHEEVGND